MWEVISWEDTRLSFILYMSYTNLVPRPSRIFQRYARKKIEGLPGNEATLIVSRGQTIDRSLILGYVV